MNKNIAITLLLIMGFLLIGFVIGFMANGYWLRQQRQQYRQQLNANADKHTETGYVELMRDVLQLSPQQEEQTDSILRLQYRETQELIHQHRQDLRDQFRQSKAQLQPYLDAKQMNAIDEHRAAIRRYLHDAINNKPQRAIPPTKRLRQ